MDKLVWDSLEPGERELRLQEAKLALQPAVSNLMEVMKEQMSSIPPSVLISIFFEDMGTFT